MKLDSGDHAAIAQQVVANMPPPTAASSDPELQRMAKRAVNVREIVGAIVSLVVIIAGGTVAYQELKAKPTVEAMDTAIEAVVAPVRETAILATDDANKNRGAIETVEKRVTRVEKVQNYQIGSTAWQGEVLEHIANKKKGKPRKRPQKLRDLERELLTK